MTPPSSAGAVPFCADPHSAASRGLDASNYDSPCWPAAAAGQALWELPSDLARQDANVRAVIRTGCLFI